MLDGAENLLELTLRLNRSQQFSKQYEKYQVLRKKQGQGTIYDYKKIYRLNLL